jgi:hypothetical protein
MMLWNFGALRGHSVPIHDWTRVEAGTFHAFHYFWIAALCHRLNKGCLPRGFFALPEQRGSIFETNAPDLHLADSERYAARADFIALHHRSGKVVAVIEVVSPGNKGSRQALCAFVDKTTQLLEQGIHLLVVDLFPPGKRDPQGIHRAILEETHDTHFKVPADKPLTLAAYAAGSVTTAYVESVAVGDVLPDMPLFLEPELYVPTPLEATYQAAWGELPEEIRELLE